MGTEAATRETLVVNLYGGPGVGKTTAAHRIMAALSERGVVCEYVPEYAKELVWDLNSPFSSTAARAEAALALDGSVASQRAIWAEQSTRVNRLLGQCDVVVCDSPTPLSLVYLSIDSVAGADYADFRELVMADYASHDNLNVLVERGRTPYETTGRLQSAGEAHDADGLVRDLLESEGLEFTRYLPGHTEARIAARATGRQAAPAPVTRER